MPMLRSQTPTEFEQASARSGLVYVPEVHHPLYPLAILKHLICGGGFFYADKGSLDELTKAARYFGGNDAFLWEHMSTVLEMYDFSAVDKEEVDTLWAIVPSFVMMVVALFGPEAAWRLWNVIFSEIVSGLEVQFNSPGEPVANLFISGDRQRFPGHDAAFPLYPKRTQHVMSRQLDQQQYMLAAMTAPMTAADSYSRIALAGATDFLHNRTAQTSHARALLPGGPRKMLPGGGVLGDFTIAGAIYRHRRDMLSDRAVTAAKETLHANYGESWFDMNAVADWGEKWRKLQDDELSNVPTFPTRFGPGQLSTLSEAHLYGAQRELTSARGGHTTTHSGLDLPDEEGLPIFALYGGEIKHVERGHKAGDKKGGNGGGNYTEVRSTSPTIPDHTFQHSYAHQLDPVDVGELHLRRLQRAMNWSEEQAKQAVAEVKKLRRGAKVVKGQLIGFVGSTGNSSGPHLHLMTSWAERDSMGKSIRKQRVDPELVLKHGAIDAGRMSGFTVNAGESTLAPAVFAINAMAKGTGGVHSTLSRQLELDLTRELDALKQKRESKEIGNLSANAPQTPAQTPQTPQTTVTTATTAPAAQTPTQTPQMPQTPPPFANPLVRSAVVAGLTSAGVPSQLAVPLMNIVDQVWQQVMAGKTVAGDVEIQTIRAHALSSLGEFEGVTEQHKVQAGEFLAGFLRKMNSNNQ